MDARTTDTVSAAALTVAVLAGTLLVPLGGENARALDPLGYTLLIVTGAAMAARRTRPLAAASVSVAGATMFYALTYPGIFAAAPAVLGVYTVMGRGRRGPALLLAATMTGVVAATETLRGAHSSDGTLWVGGWLLAVLVIGEMVRNRRDYLELVEQRAAEAERTHEETALRRASEERLWIAQELHDTLTHNISVINVQAGVALHLLDRDPDPARLRGNLTVIKESGREAMRELRATLGVLRRADPDDTSPGLTRLPRLLDRARAAGLSITHHTDGEARPLPEETDRTAYRILQESLTNALRHAAHLPVTVTTQYHPAKVIIRVDNAVPGGPATRAGQGMGLIGMRERAASVGGSLEAGPTPEGGFRVRAELPVREAP